MSHNAQRKKAYDALKYLTLVTQLGLSLAVPIILCLWIGNFLQRHFSLPPWVMLLSLLLGLGGAVSNLIKFLNYAYHEAMESEKRERGS